MLLTTMTMTDSIHPGTPVDFDGRTISPTPASQLTPRISDETLVATPDQPAAATTITTATTTSTTATRPPSVGSTASLRPSPMPPTAGTPLAALAPDEEHDGAALPELPYSLRTRKMALVVVWTVILLDSVILPLALFFALKYGAEWSDTKNLAVSNGVFGFLALVQYVMRLYRLASPEFRPLGSTRWWALDFYQHQFTIGFVAITLLMSLATGPGVVRVTALAPALLPAMCGPQLLLSCVANRLRWRLPVRFSSMPAGSITPPVVLTVVEDVVAVDGGGGREFRQAWLRRYDASPRFRRLIWDLTLFWGLGCLLCVAVALTAAFVITSNYFAFAFCWSAPFVWAAIWAVTTILWVQRQLDIEKTEWDAARAVASSDRVAVAVAVADSSGSSSGDASGGASCRSEGGQGGGDMGGKSESGVSGTSETEGVPKGLGNVNDGRAGGANEKGG